jgi:hypothetical protein
LGGQTQRGQTERASLMRSRTTSRPFREAGRAEDRPSSSHPVRYLDEDVSGLSRAPVQRRRVDGRIVTSVRAVQADCDQSQGDASARQLHAGPTLPTGAAAVGHRGLPIGKMMTPGRPSADRSRDADSGRRPLANSLVLLVVRAPRANPVAPKEARGRQRTSSVLHPGTASHLRRPGCQTIGRPEWRACEPGE